tara:strand:+ start:1312 stop:2043 length:732 start_codon:yes stop_codon:yes gene_type:complete
MANLNYEEFTESVRTILRLRNTQDDAIVKEIVQASVRDLIEEFDSGIGSRADYSLTVQQVALTTTKTVSRIYLPDDALWLIECYVGDTLITPIDMSDKKFWGDYASISPELAGLPAFVGRTEGEGTMYIEFAGNILPSDTTEISVLYRVSSSNISYIPEAYKSLLLYASIYHYRNWYILDNPAAVSKARENYREYRAKFISDQGNQQTNQKRVYEVEWKKLFRFILEGSQNNFYSRYTGQGSS